MAKGRTRSLPGVATDAGRAQVEAAQRWVRRHFNISSQIREPKPDLFWTKTVPGYEEARTSAIDAATSIIAETGFAREMATAAPQHYDVVIERWKLRIGSGSPNRIIAKIVQATPPDELLKTLRALAEDLYNAQRSGPPPPLFQEIARRIHVFSPAMHAAVGQMAALILGKEMSPLRASLPCLWIECGLWLAETPDAAAFLETQMKTHPELAIVTRPTDAALRSWISKLHLFRYRGKGRVRFDRSGVAKADHVLDEELTHVSTTDIPPISQL